MRYRLVIAPPHERPTHHAKHGTARFWIEGYRRAWLGLGPQRWCRVSPKHLLAVRQPMPNGAVWDLGEHDRMPKQVEALWGEA